MEVPFATFTDDELSDDQEVTRYVTQVFFFGSEGMGQKHPLTAASQGEDDPASDYEPVFSTEGYINVIGWTNDQDNKVEYDDTNDKTKAVITESAWTRLGGENSLFMEKSGGLMLKPLLASKTGFFDNAIDVNQALGKDGITPDANQDITIKMPEAVIKWSLEGGGDESPIMKTKTGDKEGSFVKADNNGAKGEMRMKLDNLEAFYPLWDNPALDIDDVDPGAFLLNLCVKPNAAGKSKSQRENELWKVEISVGGGDVKIILREDDRAKVVFANSLEKEPIEVQNALSHFSAGGKIKSRWEADEGSTDMSLLVYRVLNGIQIANGMQLDRDVGQQQGGKKQSITRDVSVFCRRNAGYKLSEVWSEFSDDPPVGTMIPNDVEYGGFKIPCAPAGSNGHHNLGTGEDEYTTFRGKFVIAATNCKICFQFQPVVFYGRGEEVFYGMKMEKDDDPDTPDETDATYLARLEMRPIWTPLNSHLGIRIVRYVVTNSETSEKHIRFKFVVGAIEEGGGYIDGMGLNGGWWSDDIANGRLGSGVVAETSTSDQDMDLRKTVYPNSPMLMGVLLRKNRSDYRPFLYDTGSFSLVSEGFLHERVTQLQISTSVEGGTSGSLTIDGTGLRGLEPDQSIGGLRIHLDGGYNTVANDPGDNDAFNVICFGYQFSRSADDDTWTVPFQGREAVLKDIRPGMFDYYDGKGVLDTFTEFLGLCGFPVSHLDPTFGTELMDDTEPLPSSNNPLQSPLIDFQGGQTTMMDALLRIAELSGHHFFVDIDGKAWVVQLSSDEAGTQYYWSKRKTWVYPDVDLMDSGDTPSFDDLRTKVLMVGLPINYESNRDVNDYIGNMDFKLIRKEERVTTSPAISWDRGMFKAVGGAITKEHFSSIFNQHVRDAKVVYYDTQVTVPGNAKIRLMDLIELSDFGKYVITGISHNISFDAKTWETSLTLLKGPNLKWG